jgi:hypothetical protein
MDWSQDSTVGIPTGYRLDNRKLTVGFLVGLRIFCSPHRPDQLWGPPSLLSNDYRGLKNVDLYTPPYVFMTLYLYLLL